MNKTATESFRSNEQKVWDCISAKGGATTEEVEKALNMKHQTASALVSKMYHPTNLKDPARLVQTQMARKTDSGRPARVYRVVEGMRP